MMGSFLQFWAFDCKLVLITSTILYLVLSIDNHLLCSILTESKDTTMIYIYILCLVAYISKFQNYGYYNVKYRSQIIVCYTLMVAQAIVSKLLVLQHLVMKCYYIVHENLNLCVHKKIRIGIREKIKGGLKNKRRCGKVNGTRVRHFSRER